MMDYKLIPLTFGQSAIVDAEDFEWLSQWDWYASKRVNAAGTFYAVRTGPDRKRIRMHRLILGCGPTEEGDHRNGSTLDNRRENLRKCTHLQNGSNRLKSKNNTSGFKGVTWHTCGNKWLAQIRVNYKTVSLGHYDDPVEAARAYDAAAKLYFGEFAKVNF